MTRVSLLGAVLAFAVAGPALADAAPLAGQQLRQMVVGKTVHLRVSGIELPIAYRANGTMHGQIRAFVANLVGGTPQRDSGTWWVKGDQLCQRWRNWMDGKAYCYTLRRSGSMVTWQRNDGRTGTARIGS